MSHLIISRTGDVLGITVDRPAKRNALSRVVLAEIHLAFGEHARDETIKAVVLTGAGDKCFAAGEDLKELEAVRDPEEATRFSTEAKAALGAVGFGWVDDRLGPRTAITAGLGVLASIRPPER